MRLDREVVVRAALDLLNDIGLDAFTTRRLAERLGVKQPAIYWHFKNKRELLDEMAAQMFADGRQPGPMTSDTWMEAFKEDARGFRESLLRYRDGARVHAGTRPAVNLYSSLDRRARVMCDAGFTPADAVRAMMVMSHYVVGSVIEQQSATSDGRAPVDEALFPDPKEHPVLASAIAELATDDESASFEFGLDALVAGLAAKRATRAAAPSAAPVSAQPLAAPRGE